MTKLKVFDNSVIMALGGSWLTKGVGVDTEEALGGLISLWNEDCFKIESCITNKRCIILAGVLIKLNKSVVFCNIYASSLEREKKELWEFILVSQQSLRNPWCM
ncbi:hypothetical protein Ddye_014321 [Dipteronia dyeriana]|uniref:Uncharacterized protein n=1 Tax=Dipteronia dyeriana TaxID=168575 RepID=A0AAD9X7T5_9ROSI|nr:hypothetical protein Ddye_014321 [Dipteronia dyeriana]